MSETPMSPIHQAAEAGDAAAVEGILRADPVQADLALGPAAPNRPLHLAAWQGHAEVAELLLRYGAVVNAPGDGGQTPLHFAAEHRHPDVVKLLLAHGADVSARSDLGETPLMRAAVGRDPDSNRVVALLLQHGAPLDLHSAMRRGLLDAVRDTLRTSATAVRDDPLPDELLVDAVILTRVVLNDRNPGGSLAPGAPWLEAAVAECAEVFSLLIKQGAGTARGYIALFQAVQLPHPAIARMLLEAGASPRDPDDDPEGDGLVMVARNGSSTAGDMVQLLRRHGTNG
jgi:hypothetical protein